MSVGATVLRQLNKGNGRGEWAKAIKQSHPLSLSLSLSPSLPLSLSPCFSLEIRGPRWPIVWNSQQKGISFVSKVIRLRNLRICGGALSTEAAHALERLLANQQTFHSRQPMNIHASATSKTLWTNRENREI